MECVPTHMAQHVKTWLYEVLEDKPGPPMSMRSGHENTLTQEIMLRLGLVHCRPWEITDSDEALIIDAVDAVLFWTPWSLRHGVASPSDLQRILAAGNSALRISDQFDGLEPVLQDAQVTDPGGSTGHSTWASLDARVEGVVSLAPSLRAAAGGGSGT
jgi:hypothetical protein